MTEELEVGQRKKLAVRFVAGTVIELKGWSETRTTGTTQHTGVVTASGLVVGGGTTVNTINVSKQELWIRHDDGKEECINFFRKVIQTRPGHRVLIALGGGIGKPPMPLAIHRFNEDSTEDFMTDGGYLLTTGMHSMWGRLLMWVIYAVCFASMVGIPLIPILFVIVHVRRRMLLNSISNVVMPRMKTLVATDRSGQQQAAEAAVC